MKCLNPNEINLQVNPSMRMSFDESFVEHFSHQMMNCSHPNEINLQVHPSMRMSFNESFVPSYFEQCAIVWSSMHLFWATWNPFTLHSYTDHEWFVIISSPKYSFLSACNFLCTFLKLKWPKIISSFAPISSYLHSFQCSNYLFHRICNHL